MMLGRLLLGAALSLVWVVSSSGAQDRSESSKGAHAERQIVKIRSTGTLSADAEADVGDSAPAELTSSLGVFRRDRVRATDRLPPARTKAIQSVAAGFDRNVRHVGAPLLDASRLALAPSTASLDDGVYLVPTESGGVCYLVGDVGVGCMAALVDGLIGWNLVYRPIEPVQGRYEIVSVHGVVTDSVREVEVVFAEDAERPLKFSATVGGNAFRLSLPDEGRVNPRSLRGFEIRTADDGWRWIPARN